MSENENGEVKPDAAAPADASAGAAGAAPSDDEALMAAALKEAESNAEKEKPPQQKIFDLLNSIKKGDNDLNRLNIQNLDFILDVPIKVTVELGRTKLMIKDLLQLGQGSVLELNKVSGDPLEILVNGKLVARGEVVVVNEKFGIRINEILGPIERIETLR